MNRKETRAYKKTLKLTKRQRDILVGLLLGDGHLETQDSGRTYRLKVEHGVRQKDYVAWLYAEFQNWIPATSPYTKTRANGQVSVGFTTYSHGALRFYGKAFYTPQGIKRIPAFISKVLTPIGVAVWFMDDGSRKSPRHATYNIHTLGYTKKDLVRLQDALRKCFGIDTTLHRQKRIYWRIYIPSRSAIVFTELVRRYVKPIASMRTKLAMMPKK